LHVYYTEILYNKYESEFVGVFSTTERAQAACNAGCEQQDALIWEGRGDGIRSTDDVTGYTYWIAPLAVDRAVLAQYNPPQE
jgi:hypothetical protein